VFGGKITTYRRLAEAAMAQLAPHLAVLERPPWTGTAPLPGGDFPPDGFPREVARLRGDFPWLPATLAERLVRAYGTRAEILLDGADSLADLGARFGADLTEREVAYLMEAEWARAPDDVLWRRSKLGLRIGAEGRAALAAFMTARRPAAASVA
jgi:glycerol-3-phosphate dehydrogenase